MNCGREVDQLAGAVDRNGRARVPSGVSVTHGEPSDSSLIRTRCRTARRCGPLFEAEVSGSQRSVLLAASGEGFLPHRLRKPSEIREPGRSSRGDHDHQINAAVERKTVKARRAADQFDIWMRLENTAVSNPSPDLSWELMAAAGFRAGRFLDVDFRGGV